ncbi:MAG: hypothetical protein IPM98_19930 [Lewinellaceae bacterium]|nr:hypothetical protein [Lewinellaceae bacterium]
MSTPIEFEITVNPVPNVDLVDNQTVCNGDQVSQIDFTGNVPGTVFNWTNNTPSIGLAAAGSDLIPAFTAINNTNAPVTATITVTPEFIAGGDTCTGTPLVFTITVNPVPSVNPVADQTVCAGENVPQIDFSGNVPGASFSWTRTPEAIGLPANSGGNFVPAFIAANAGNTPLTSTFTVTASFTGNGLTCMSTPIEFEITVNPVPNVDLVDNQTVCNGDQVSQIDFTGNVPGTVFNWITAPVHRTGRCRIK